MYANRIRLTATEAGVGVRMLGDAAASAEDFTLSAAGRVELYNRISAQRDVLVASTSNEAAAIALAGATLNASRKLDVAARQGGLGIRASTLIAEGDMRATGTRLDAGEGSHLQAGGALDLGASAGDLALGAAALRAGGDLHLGSTGQLSIAGGDSQGVQSTGGHIAIDAQAGLNNAGVVSADQGDVTLRAGSRIANSGSINAGRNLNMGDAAGGASQSLDNTGKLLAGQAMTTRAARVGNSGWMQAGGANTIDAASLDNSGKVIAATGTATLRVERTIDNSGSVRAAQDIVVTGRDGTRGAQQLNNSGDMLAAGAVNLHAAAFDNSAAGWIQAATGSTISAGTLDNAGTWLLSQQPGGTDRVDVVGGMTNTGTLQSAGDAALTAATLDNRHVLAAAGNLSARTSGALINADGSVLQAGQSLALSSGGALANRAGATLSGADVKLNAAQGIVNAGYITASTGDTTVRADGTIDNSGKIHAGGTLDIADASGGAGETLDNSGLLIADGALALQAADVQNRAGGWIQAASTSTVDASSLNNEGTWLMSTQAGGPTSRIQVAGALTNSGAIQAQQDAALVANRIDNQANASLRTGGNLGTTVSNGFTNAGIVQAGGTLGIAATASGLVNQAGGKLLGDRLDIHAAGIDNAGIVQGGTATDSQLTVDGTLTNQGSGVLTMGAASGATPAGSGTVSATTVANAGALQSQGGLIVKLGTGGLSGTGDILAAGDLGIAAQGSNNYTATIGGTLQSGGELSVKGADSTLTLAQGQSASGRTVDVDVGTIDLQKNAVLASDGNMRLHAATLKLAGDASGTARVLAAKESGTNPVTATATVNVDNALTNNGLLFSGGDLNLTAPRISNGTTGGIAALGTLTATASSGDFTNAGALYGGEALIASAPQGTLTNTGTRTAYVGSIDSDGAITLNAKTVVNQSAVNAGTNLTINATDIQNVVYGGDDRVWETGERTTTENDYQKWDGHNGYRERWNYTDSWQVYQRYASGGVSFNNNETWATEPKPCSSRRRSSGDS